MLLLLLVSLSPVLGDLEFNGPSKSSLYPTAELLSIGGRTWTESTKKAVSDAANFFLEKMTEDSWGDFTPRAVVALSFADRVVPIRKEYKSLMLQQLDINLRADLIHKSTKDPSSLSQYINALYATCQDPRRYKEDMDFVNILRSATDVAMKSDDFGYPIALLTLCVADQVTPGDLNKLMNLYNTAVVGNRVDIKALVIMAMTCIGRKTRDNRVANYVQHFVGNEQFVNDSDVYTKALYLQAVHAANLTSDVKLGNQLPDGSFGDMLATYTALPALLNSSLLDLRCNSKTHEELVVKDRVADNKNSYKKTIVYSLYIESEKGLDTRSMRLTFEGNKTFYDIMRMAEARDTTYSFLYDETDQGKKVCSLAMYPNDAESKKSWVLYKGSLSSFTVLTPDYLEEIESGIDRIYPQDKTQYYFWFKKVSK